MPWIRVKHVRRKLQRPSPSLKRKPWAWLKRKLKRVSAVQWTLGTAMVLLPFAPYLLGWIYPLGVLSLFFGWYSLLLLACCVVLFMARSIRAPASLGALAILLAYGLPYLHDLKGDAEASHGAKNGQLVVVTRNWLETNSSYEGFFAWLRADHPDIVAIQETPSGFQDHYNEIAKAYPYITTQGLARDLTFISRYPIVKATPLPIGDHFALEAELATPYGHIRVYDLHPDTLINPQRWNNRNDFLEQLPSLIDTGGLPTLVLGDFNAPPWEPRLQALKASLEIHEQPQLIPATTRVLSHISGLYFGATIDHILGNEQIELSDCRALPQYGSDHRPLMCTARF